ncbi:MAG TPA: T9SS type A sorting domain-containing protein, partial [Flavobacterium sp.]|nr:T9SS type A sorting domain-containing protein [Flavobacterium sp.]
NAGVSAAVAGPGCVQASKVALEGAFSIGYKSTFETIGTDVKITFELLDTDKAGVVAFLRKQGEPAASEVPMTNVPGTNIFTKTITGQTPGAIINYGVKFAFAGGLAVTEFVSYEVGTDCAATNDLVAPTNFSATIGAITASSVEIILDGVDASGTILYSVSYGSVTKSTTSDSGVPKSFVMTALAPDTDYIFSVTAKDLVGNIAFGSPKLLPARTAASTNTECAGTASEAQPGDSFSVGYNYAFQTINGTDVKITFELLDNKGVELAYLWRQSPFAETGPMTKTGNIVTSTITGQTPGATISYGVKFIFVGGGAAVTKYFSYVVGNTCSLGVENSSELKQSFYPNPVKNMFYLQLLDEQNRIMLTDMLGRKILEEVVKSSHTLNMSAYKTGVYLLRVENSRGVQNVKIVKE